MVSPEVADMRRESILMQTQEIEKLMEVVKSSGLEGEIPEFYDSPVYHPFRYNDSSDKFALAKTLEYLIAARCAIKKSGLTTCNKEQYEAIMQDAGLGVPKRSQNPNGSYEIEQLNKLLGIIEKLKSDEPGIKIELTDAIQ